MHFHILTLFPDMVLSGLKTSILGRACEKGLLSIEAENIRDYTKDKHKKVDDYPYGGGAGMLMQAQPVFDAYQAVLEKRAGAKTARVIYVTPQGRLFDQSMAKELAKEEELIFLCGHYEGIDERVLEEIVTDYVSIGDYVLTGGELPAMVMIDAISRMVPGVLKNEESGETESFHENLLEYPQYTRPEVWREKEVPQVLLCGDHAKVDAWRLARSVERTKRQRPDLYEKYDLPGRALLWLKQDRLLHMDMLENIRRGRARVLCVREDGVLLQDKGNGLYMVSAQNRDAGERLLSLTEPEGAEYVCHQRFLADSVAARFQKETMQVCLQAAYTRKTPFAEDLSYEIRALDETFTEGIFAHYHAFYEKEKLRAFLKEGVIYGAFLPKEETARKETETDRTDGAESGGTGQVLAGFIGTHEEGGMGMLEVFEPFRRRGIAQALETHLINRTLERGETPYCQIFAENEASIALQEKLGLKVGAKKIYWIS